MGELLPSLQSRSIRDGLSDYLKTTFALADRSVRDALGAFLEDPEHGMFSGPFVRTRMPFEPAAAGWEDALDHYSGFPPYGHQAEAFARLTSKDPAVSQRLRRPEPTIVTTGTGSGKTEAFLAPILDHVLRARALGVTGVKALILYPMNALATDQARRLTELIAGEHADPALRGVRAGLYVGSEHSERTTVSADGLITSRHAMREDPPDVLLTNYKMLDQLLLRREDAPLWERSATSLTYLVLDEFHTYDGAQGTDVAMLLRRLGLALKAHWPADLPDERAVGPIAADAERPLGMVTPVATSATLGGKGDPGAMLDVARTVFGETFPDDAVITESRRSVQSWRATRSTPVDVVPASMEAVRRRLETLPAPSDRSVRPIDKLTTALWPVLFDPAGATATLEAIPGLDPSAAADPLPALPPDDLTHQADALAYHPLVHALLSATEKAAGLDDLARTLLGTPEESEGRARSLHSRRMATLTDLLAVLSHLRTECGRDLPGVEVHLWVRELSRIDRALSPAPAFSWSDDGTVLDAPSLPAAFCRRCGRSGWMIGAPRDTGGLDTDAATIRRASAGAKRDVRVLLHAPEEGELHLAGPERPDPRLGWYAIEAQELVGAPTADSADFAEGHVLPVLHHHGDDAAELSDKETCPACGETDAIRYVGSAIATLLSVAITTQFGEVELDEGEKKALVFTDSVQDAAHRAGFVQSRSHVFSLRAALAGSVPEGPDGIRLAELVTRVVDGTESPADRYMLVPPDLVHHPAFRPYWDRGAGRSRRDRGTVERRLLFDTELEFGLNSRTGRTLELTGALSAEVDTDADALLDAARTAWETLVRDANLLEVNMPEDEQLVRWARGVLERMRQRGAVFHEFLREFVARGGDRYPIWGGRNRAQGAPAFPSRRPAPAFPLVGPRTHDTFDVVTATRGWYARWTGTCLGQTARDGAFLATALLTQLAKREVVQEVPSSAGTAYALLDRQLVVRRTDRTGLAAGHLMLECSVCHAAQPAGPSAHPQLTGAPCFTLDCPGTLAPAAVGETFYRRTYLDARMRRVVAHEHTSLLPDKERLLVETRFKDSDATTPDAPNVLVATPTLEMGIDIGDLTTVMLSSLPRSVAGYLQRVGRAGRLTGSSLLLSFVRGRGEHLPKIHDPLSVLNGEVRPPATYLGAGEILRRQYIASLLDRMARDETRPVTLRDRQAEVLDSIAEGTLLGDLVRDHDSHAEELTATFLGAYGPELDDRAREELRTWTDPGDGASGLWRIVADASARYATDVEGIRERIARLQEALPALEEAASLPSNQHDDEAQRAPKIAFAGLRNLRRQLGDLREGHWIGALERYGLLPNFTLYDDGVDLDVEMTFKDHLTDQWDYEAMSFRRGAASALTEFAPGNTFYGHGREIRIDAVDMGHGGSAVERWQVCPQCGWVQVLDTAELTAATCARCRTDGVRDVSQVLDVLPFTAAGAVVRRDESAISDRSDDRENKYFQLATLADLVPGHAEPTWWIDGFPFGVQMAHRVLLRRLNLGKLGVAGADLTLGGMDHRAPKFRVCEACGQLDQDARANSRSEHRPWCPHRTSDEEHTRAIVLAHTLETQGMLLRLPRSISAQSSFALPSLSAALLLGLREDLGGSPDHLDVTTIADPHRGTPSLLLHDTVPGGTGYLVDYARPEGLRRVLEKAFEIVVECECRGEERIACHRCLLPFAPQHQAEKVSRAVAASVLTELLSSGAADTPEDLGDPRAENRWWSTYLDEAAPEEGPESHLETRFRLALTARLTNAGWKAVERPGDGRWPVVELTAPAGARWTLNPQPLVDFTQPDFELARRGRPEDRMLVYTDGLRFHASVENNVVAEDAQKRTRLRHEERGIPWSVTMQDVEQFEQVTAARESNVAEPVHPTPGWYDEAAMTAVLGRFSLDRTISAHVPRNALEQLVLWMQRPERDAWVKVTEQLGLVLSRRAVRAAVAAEAPAEVALAHFAGAAPEPGPRPSFAYRNGALIAAAVGSRPDALRVEAVLDDREASIVRADFPAQWREWLHLSNLLGLRSHRTHAGEAMTTKRLLDLAAESASRGERDPLLQGIAALAAEADVDGTLEPRVDIAVPRGAVELTSQPAPMPEDAPAAAEGSDETRTERASTWSLADLADDLELTPEDLRSLLERISDAVAIPAPLIGEEVDGVVVEFLWPAPGGGPGVVVDAEEADTAVAEAAGWQVVPPEDDAVLAALRAHQIITEES